MSVTTSNRLSLLVRKNEGKKLLSPLKAEIVAKTAIAKDDLGFIPLEESDPIRQRFETVFAERQEQQSSLVSKTWKDISDFKQDMSRIATIFFLKAMYLFFQVSDKIGALRIDSERLFNNAPGFLEVDGDSVYACNEDLSFGLVLDKYEEDGKWVYEALVWGDKLKDALLD